MHGVVAHEWGEGVGAGADGVEEHEVAGVADSCPSDGNVVLQDGSERGSGGAVGQVGRGAMALASGEHRGDLLGGQGQAGAGDQMCLQFGQRGLGPKSSRHAFEGDAETGYAVERFAGTGIADEARVGIAVVSGDDDQGIGILLLEGEDDGEGSVEIELFVDERGGVVVVRGVVDTAAFDLEHEAGGAAIQAGERGGGHLGERGHGGGEGWVAAMVEAIREMFVGEEAEKALGGRGGGEQSGAVEDDGVPVGGGEFVGDVAMVGALGRKEEAAATGEADIESAFKVLDGNLLFLGALSGVGEEAGGCGVGEAGGGDQADGLAGAASLDEEGFVGGAVGGCVRDAPAPSIASWASWPAARR